MQRDPQSVAERTPLSVESKVAFLGQPHLFADGSRRVDVIETRLSWVFLSGHFAYKFKKPVHEPLIDFRTLQGRRINCEREVRLNRRLAAPVYLGVVALTRDNTGALDLGGAGEVVEWLVHMRRLPHEQMLDHALAHGGCEVGPVKRAADVLAGFYARTRPEQLPPADYVRRLEGETVRRVRTLQSAPWAWERRRLQRLLVSQRQFLGQRRTLLESRAANGHVVEGHGDLRPQHVCLAPQPWFIDCLEFSRVLRVLDPLDDLAYLVLECERDGAAWVGDAFVQAYAHLTGDDFAHPLVPFYASRRAVLRAFQSLRHIREDRVPRPLHWTARAQRYLALAERNMERALAA